MALSELVTLVTALVAVYGAALSTYIFISNRRERKRQVKVTMSLAVLGTSPEVTDIVALTAANPGSRPVTLTGVTVEMPDENKYVLFKPGGDVSLPYTLEDGKNCTQWLKTRGLAEWLRKEGHSGVVRLVGVFRDAVGTRYHSSPFGFDIDKWV